MKLQGNTILITGGSSGIGLELARVLSKNNCVLICGRSQEKLVEAQRQMPSLNTFQCDIANRHERAQLTNWVAENYPDCNVLVNNAAIVHKTHFANDPDMISKAELEIQTNLIAPVALTHSLLPVMKKNSNPAIINITTGLVYAPRIVYPIYNSTKAGLHSFTQVLREQLRPVNVSVVEVLMSVVDTPWHGGEPPRIAITPQKAVSEMITEWEKGKEEIRIGKVKLLYLLSRFAPRFAFKKINSV